MLEKDNCFKNMSSFIVPYRLLLLLYFDKLKVKYECLLIEKSSDIHRGEDMA